MVILREGTKKISGIVGCEVPKDKHTYTVMKWASDQLEQIGFQLVANERKWVVEKDGKVYKLFASYFQDHNWYVDHSLPKYKGTDGTIIVSNHHDGIYLVPK